jgi:hypothetical protein
MQRLELAAYFGLVLFHRETTMNRLVSVLIVTAAGLGGAIPASAQYLPPTANLLLRYDSDQNGIVSRAEMDAGVNADYEMADLDGSDCISGQEIRAENERRLNRDGGVASPIADWNLDGCVNMNEFGSSIRNYFSFVERSGDGQVTAVELRGPSMPITLPAPPGANQAAEERPRPSGGTIPSQGVVSAPASILDPTSPEYYGYGGNY